MRSLFSILARKEMLAFSMEPSPRKYPLNMARYFAFTEFIQAELRRMGGAKLLDVGCGVGKLIRYGPFPGATFVGLDIRLSSLEMARQQAYQHLVVGDAGRDLPFEDESFDIVVCNHVLEHLHQPEALIQEARRVLRPGGLLLVGVPMVWWWTRWLRIHVLPLLVRRKRPELLAAEFGHVYFFTMLSLKELLKAFAIEDVRGFRFFSSRHLPLENWWWYYRLNTWWGRVFPRLTSEVNVVARKH